MNALFRKLKKRSKFQIITYFILLLSYLLTGILISKNILGLTGIENELRIIFIMGIVLFFIIYFIFGFLSIMDKRKKTFILLSILNFICIPIFILLSVILIKTFNTIDGLNSKYVNYTTHLITLKETKFNKNNTIGLIKDKTDIEGYILPNEYIKKKHLNNEIIYYEDYTDMLLDLYENKIDSIFITSNYVNLYQNEEEFTNISTDTKIIDSYSKKMKNIDNTLASNKSLDEPFTILLMGVDSEADGLDANMAYNGDTLMLITFNPETLNATIFSIPRDMYVPIACRNNQKAKINSSAAHGTECVINTVENLTEVNIDYYVKINFKGVVDLVEALNGIEVNVGKDFCEQNSKRQFGDKEICLKKGVQTLNGEQALAFARHRHSLLRGDIDRIQNQQLVVEAIMKKAKNVRSINEFEDIINSITNNMLTNMNREQILSFYEVGKSMLKNTLHGDDFITIDKTYLEYYDLPVNLGSRVTSALGYYNNSLDAIKQLMKNNLSTEDINSYVNFTFTSGEPYERLVTGKGLTGSKNDVSMPKLIGKNINDAQYIANQIGFVINVNYIDSDTESSGTIIDQSIAYGSLINKGVIVTLTVVN